MFKWFKKQCKKLIIASSILTACVCGLFGFTRSYAYDYDDTMNTLFGNNVFASDVNNYNYRGLVNDSTITSTFNVDSYGNPYVEFNFNNYNSSSIIDFYVYNTQLYGQNNYRFRYCDCILVQPNFTSSNNSVYLSTFVGGYNQNFNEYRSSQIFQNTFGDFQPNYNCIYVKNNYFMSSINNYYYGFHTLILNNNSQTINGTLRLTYMAFENSSLDTSASLSAEFNFVPYSSIEQLQRDYDSLQQQYNDYVASHSHSNTEYNSLVSSNTLLQQQIQTLQLQYDTYVATHTHTDNEYNNLLQGYEDLLDTQRELESDYELLQDQYNELLNKYQRYQNPASYGWFTYIDYIQAYNSSYDSGEVSFDELVAEGYVSNYTFLLDDFVNDHIEADDGTLHVDIVFRENVVPLNLFEFTFTDMTYSGYLSVKNFYMNTNGSSFTYFFNHNVINVREYYYMEHGTYPDETALEFAKAISQYIYVNQITLDSVPLNSDVHDFTIVSNDAVDSYSFNLGFQSGYYNGTLTNNDLKSQINDLNKKINELYTNINTLRNLNTELQDQISNSYGWKSLFFAMADTPFKTVSNVLGFELFGLNLFTTFIGIITVFAIIWILKKFI